MYKVGDKVFHLYGSRHVIVIPSDGGDTVFCPVCGAANEYKWNACRRCKHTLIKHLPL